MESGIIKLAPVFVGSAETTAAEMKEYMQGVVTRFCEVTGFVVLETVDHDKGAFFILGEEGKTQGLIAIGNSSGNNYFNTFALSNIGPYNEIRISTSLTGYSTNNEAQACAIGTNPVWMKYVKTDYGIVIGFGQSSSPSVPAPAIVLQKIHNGIVEELAILRIYSVSCYASYNPNLCNEAKDTVMFNTAGCNKNIIPPDKEAMAEIYLENGVELPGMRLYTNKKNTENWKKVRIGGVQYIVVMKGNYASGNYALLMQATDTAAQT